MIALQVRFACRQSCRLAIVVLLAGLLSTGCADMRVADRAAANGDVATARKNYAPLAAFGIPEAQYAYANMLLTDQDVTTRPLARRYLEQSYAQGNERAAYALARLYQDGIGGPVEADKAETLYKTLQARGDARAAAKLGDLYTDENEIERARAAYLKSYQDGNGKAAERIGDLYAKYTVPPDHDKALIWYKRAQDAKVDGATAKIVRENKKLHPAAPRKSPPKKPAKRGRRSSVKGHSPKGKTP